MNIEKEITELKTKVQEISEQKTIISLREYEILKNGLEEYYTIKELKPIAEMMRREIDRLIVYM